MFLGHLKKYLSFLHRVLCVSQNQACRLIPSNPWFILCSLHALANSESVKILHGRLYHFLFMCLEGLTLGISLLYCFFILFKEIQLELNKWRETYNTTEYTNYCSVNENPSQFMLFWSETQQVFLFFFPKWLVKVICIRVSW